MTFEDVADDTLVRNEYLGRGVRITGTGENSGRVLTEGDFGTANFGNSPTRFVSIGLRDEPTTIHFVDPSSPANAVGATAFSLRLGDGDPYFETIAVTYRGPAGQLLSGPTTYNLFDKGVLLSANSQDLGSSIGSIELRLASISESGALFDDLAFNLETGDQTSWPGAIFLDIEGFNDNFVNPPTIVRTTQNTIAFVSVMALFPNDSDVIRFMGLASGQVVTTMMTPIDFPTPPPDTVAASFDSAEELVDFNDDAGTSIGSIIRSISDGSEPFFVGISGLPDAALNHDEAGFYIVTAGIVTPDLSANIVTFQRQPSPSVRAGIITLVARTVQRIPVSGLQAGDVISAATTPFPAINASGHETRLGLFNSAGALLADNDDAGGLGSALHYRVNQPGDYEIRITSWHDDRFIGSHDTVGDFALVASLVPAPEPDVPTLLGFGGLFTILYARCFREKIA